MRFRQNSKKGGSVLLIVLMLMSVVMLSLLGLSTILVREVRISALQGQKAQAYYAAEGAVELALLSLKREVKGWEPGTGFLAGLYDDIDLSVQIKNKNQIYPAIDQDKIYYVYLDSLKNTCRFASADDALAIAVQGKDLMNDMLYFSCTYKKLTLNQTDIIPLFANGGKVTNFQVQYYAPNLNFLNKFSSYNNNKSAVDILRWKIYGNAANSSATESISDFYPGTDNMNSNNPLCIGTSIELGWIKPKGFSCILPYVREESNSRPIFSGARECYKSDAGAGVTAGLEVITQDSSLVSKYGAKGVGGGECSMSNFISSHENNYLMLTNMIQPQMLGVADPLRNVDKAHLTDIYYRVVAEEGEEVTLAQAEITAQAMMTKTAVSKTINASWQNAAYLPVFNFSLYNVGSDE